MAYQLRPPVVAVLGHVDHGKTSLLDYFRKTNVSGKEVGGITQSIGASVVTSKDGKKITFIDTPGHATFSKMRSYGVSACDIAILVVAADDGVRPQTRESLLLINDSRIPFIVVATKIDLVTADVEKVRSELEKEGVSFERRGGDTILAAVSSKTGQGVEDLLEIIVLLSEVRDIKGDNEAPLYGVVIESSKDKRGTLVSVVIKNGTLKLGETLAIDGMFARVRGIFDWRGLAVKESLPGEPPQVLGFSELPPVGGIVRELENEEFPNKKEINEKPKTRIQTGIPILIKTRSKGSLEAILGNIPSGIEVISLGVGDVSESGVLLAKSLKAQVISFEAKIPAQVKKLARKEGVITNSFNIIYELLEYLQEILKKETIEILGKVEIIASFPFDGKKVAGGRVIEGKISKLDKLILYRGEKKLGEIKVVSLKKGKLNVSEAKAGEEFGIIFEPQLDFVVGDVLLSVKR